MRPGIGGERRGSWLGAVSLVLVLVIAACGDDDGDAADNEESAAGDASSSTDDEGCTEARQGGTLSMVAGAIPSRGLDPTVALGSSAGATEHTAIYDSLMIYDPETGEIEPHVAESLEPNDDFSQWTLTLREGIEFGNGDPLTAEAVRFSVERLAEAEVVAAAMAQEVASMEVVDDRTIVFTLVRPWAGFPYYFVHEGGIVVNPRVVEELGEDFPNNPVGAGVGPYEVERFAPDEEIVLQAKDDYWGGPVCIQTLRFVTIAGAQATYDAFRAGELDAMFLGDAMVIAEARDAGVTGEAWISGGSGYLLNSGRGASPVLADAQLRQAIAHALDLDTINERVFGGTALMASGLTHPDQQIYAGIDGPEYDPDRARELVEEVKAEGEWDGTVRLTCNDTPEQVEQTITTEAMLEAVGFEVEPENLPTSEANQKVLLDGNYDIGCGQASVFEESPLRGMNQFRSEAPNNRVGYGAPELDRAIEGLYEVADLDETAEAMRELQEVWNEHVPAVWFRAGEWFVGWDDTVHGLTPSRAGVVLFHDAYVE